MLLHLTPVRLQEIKHELEKRKEAEANSVKNAVKELGSQIGLLKPDTSAVGTNATGQHSKFIWSVLYNLIAVVILVIFFYIVRFVLRESNMFGSNASS